MSMLAFFPWLELAETRTYAEFELVSYRREELPGGSEQPIIDKILLPYGYPLPVPRATLVKLVSHSALDNLSDDERNALFTFSELLAFSALAKREYFSGETNYWNRTTFDFVIQSFDDPLGGILVLSLRRDGGSRTIVTKDACRFTRPIHATGRYVPVDANLQEALLLARNHPYWKNIYEAILNFNIANREDYQIPLQAVVVLTVGAFERLLGCKNGKGIDLVKSVTDLWSSESKICFSQCPRLQSKHPVKDKQLDRALSGWIDDFYVLRGNLAHGKFERKGKSRVWTPQEHLLFSSYAFPLLVKQKLAEFGLYKLTDDDRFDIEIFETLLGTSPFEPDVAHRKAVAKRPGVGEEDIEPSWPWSVIRREEKARIMYVKMFGACDEPSSIAIPENCSAD